MDIYKTGSLCRTIITPIFDSTLLQFLTNYSFNMKVLIVLLAALSLVSGAPALFQEDPEPITTVDTCGGFVNSSSVSIDFSGLTPGQRCAWSILGPFNSNRFQLTESGLGADDHLYATKFDASGNQVEIITVGQNHTFLGGLVIVTLIVGDAPGQGFQLHFFSSGSIDTTPALTGFASLSDSIGSHTYPATGQYRNGENALFIVNPDVGNTTLKFSSIDLESSSGCQYDAVTLFTWTNAGYNSVLRFCGTTRPAAFQIPGGLALVTFVTDSSVVGRGFTFDWAYN